jgi:hypothetical protein
MTVLALAAPATPLLSWTALTEYAGNASQAMSTNTGFTFPNNGYVVVRYSCVGGTAGNMLLNVQMTIDGLAVSARSLAMTNTHHYLLGPFKPSFYNDGAGLVHIDKSTSASGDYVDVFLLPYGFNG